MYNTKHYVGSRVRLTTDDSVFEGTIYSIDFNCQRATLEKVVNINNGKKLHGLKNFFGNELQNLDILEEGKPTSVVDDDGSKKLICIERKPSHLKYLTDLDDSILLRKYRNTEREETKYESGVESGPEEIATKYCLIDQQNDGSLQLMVKHLSNQQTLGVAVQGVNIGRKGKLCLVQIASETKLVVFDIVTLGKSVVVEDIKSILENKRIQKVIHDCRQMSDLFFNQFSIRMENVFDTQVADIIIQKRQTALFPKYVRTLAVCVTKYLGVDSDQLGFLGISESTRNEDESVWEKRPLPNSLLDYAAKKVAYNLDLGSKLHSLMLSDFTSGVNEFLSLSRASDEDSNYQSQHPHLFPNYFKKAMNFENNVRWEKYVEPTEDGLNERVDSVHNKDIIFSKDGMMHKSYYKIASSGSSGKVLCREKALIQDIDNVHSLSPGSMIELPIHGSQAPKHLKKRLSNTKFEINKDCISDSKAHVNIPKYATISPKMVSARGNNCSAVEEIKSSSFVMSELQFSDTNSPSQFENTSDACSLSLTSSAPEPVIEQKNTSAVPVFHPSLYNISGEVCPKTMNSFTVENYDHGSTNLLSLDDADSFDMIPRHNNASDHQIGNMMKKYTVNDCPKSPRGIGVSHGESSIENMNMNCRIGRGGYVKKDTDPFISPVPGRCSTDSENSRSDDQKNALLCPNSPQLNGQNMPQISRSSPQALGIGRGLISSFIRAHESFI